MDGLEPYTDGYTSYEPGYPGNPGTVSQNSKPDSTTEQMQDVGALVVFDPRRLSEVSLSEPLPAYSPTSRTRTSEIPLTAYRTDTRRISIHPLGITDRPSGVSETRWLTMDRDGLLVFPGEITSYGIGQKTVEGVQADVKDSKQRSVVRASGAGGSGGGGDYDEGEGGEGLDPTEMPFLDHLEEFRWALLKSIFALIIGMVLSWYFSGEFIGTITKLGKDAGIDLVAIQLLATIMIRLKTALFMGLVITLPFIFYFLWSFVSPGLYRKEKKLVLPLVIGATVCFLIGALLAYFLILPLMLKFVNSLPLPDVKNMIDVSNFIDLMLKFTIAFGLVFELPMITYILAKIGIIKHTLMSQYRKYAIVFIFLAAGIITPTIDPFTQIAVAIPLLILYEVSILVARIAGRKTLI